RGRARHSRGDRPRPSWRPESAPVHAHDAGARVHRAHGRPAAGTGGRGTGPAEAGLHADPARRGRRAAHAVVAGGDHPEPPPRRRRQGQRWLAHLLRAPGRVRPGWEPRPRAGRGDAKPHEAPANLKPVGTGPYRIVDFKPGDTIRAELNPSYHRPNWPFFDRLEMKGGGDAVSAARAVIQSGEYDFAWNVQVEDDILRRMEQGGRGRVDLADSGNVEHLAVNFS